MSLKRIQLEFGCTKEAPEGNPNCGYEFIAPLDAAGRFDADAWRKHRDACIVRRFWQDADDEHGTLVHTRGRKWVFSYAPGEDDDEARKVKALNLGADDYVTKPFGIDELTARLRAALRHRLQQQGEKPVFRSGDLAVDLVRRIVTVRGEDVKLSPREYDLLRVLVAHAGKVLTNKFILREVWGGETDVQYLRIYIRAWRQKIDPDPQQPQLILTEQGVELFRGARLARQHHAFLGEVDFNVQLVQRHPVLEIAVDPVGLLDEQRADGRMRLQIAFGPRLASRTRR